MDQQSRNHSSYQGRTQGEPKKSYLKKMRLLRSLSIKALIR